ncbi:MAG: hypothetical protein M3Z01_09515 [Thermoproteota archaeon]|nr:hypothetical protein [Thermoproteota archaeon]
MRDKWKARNKKNKGYLKIHIATVNVKSKKILSIKNVTDEQIHEGKALPKLVVEGIVKSDDMT